MRRPALPLGRRAIALVVVGVLVAATALTWWLRRGDGPADVAERYLEAQWRGQWATQCELAAPQWRRVVYNGFPFADCEAYADAARRAEKADGVDGADGGSAQDAGAVATLEGFARFRADTRVEVTTEEVSSGDGRARVSYLVRLTYTGDDRAGFDALWQGGPAEDRGTVELVDDDGWVVAGVDGS